MVCSHTHARMHTLTHTLTLPTPPSSNQGLYWRGLTWNTVVSCWAACSEPPLNSSLQRNHGSSMACAPQVELLCLVTPARQIYLPPPPSFRPLLPPPSFPLPFLLPPLLPFYPFPSPSSFPLQKRSSQQWNVVWMCLMVPILTPSLNRAVPSPFFTSWQRSVKERKERRERRSNHIQLV